MTQSLVGIDSNILIYLFAKPTDPEKRRLTKRASNLVEYLQDDQKRIICVSIISVSEFLVRIPESQHTSVMHKLQEKFRIAPFNLHAASVAAEIAATVAKSSRVIRHENDRPCLMADTKILGSLIAARTTEIYSNDSRLISIIAESKKAKGIPLPDHKLTLLQSLDPEDEEC